MNYCYIIKHITASFLGGLVKFSLRKFWKVGLILSRLHFNFLQNYDQANLELLYKVVLQYKVIHWLKQGQFMISFKSFDTDWFDFPNIESFYKKKKVQVSCYTNPKWWNFVFQMLKNSCCQIFMDRCSKNLKC